jgi:signal transduction histidine kinase
MTTGNADLRRAPLSNDGSRFLLSSARWLPLAIMAAGLAVGLMVFFNHLQAGAQLKERLKSEYALRLTSAREHVEDYFDSVFSSLYFISQDAAVQAMSRDSRELIQRLYNHQLEHHRLSHVYVIERDFDGTKVPFQTFEPFDGALFGVALHPLSRELEEYQVQKAQIQRFAGDPNLRALISSEIQLCVEAPEGGRAKGFVYSLPIRAGGDLVGIVAGMAMTRTIEAVLGQGQSTPTSFLVNEWGGSYGGTTAPAELRDWVRSNLSEMAAAQSPARGFEEVQVGDWAGFWTPVHVVSGERWWLISFYNPKGYLAQGFIAGRTGALALALALALTGLLLGLLVRSMAQRLQDEVRHLREREAMERRLQHVIEAEQRRIGFTVHEDLCQRLCGIGYLMTVLERQAQSKETDVSAGLADISAKLKEAFTCAQRIADDLQPVSSLDEGFLAAVLTLASRTRKETGVECEVEAGELPAIQTGVATHLYRIAQEAVANALRHGKAKRIRIRLTVEPGRLVMIIADDGVGLPPGVDQTAGVGLHLMRYRCHLAGATLDVAPARASSGTVVTCRCPVVDHPRTTGPLAPGSSAVEASATAQSAKPLDTVGK